MILRHEWMDVQRIVHLNQREHPKGGPRTSLGHSIGHFEGDTLVIETGNYSAGVLNQYVEAPGQPTRGLLHSAALTTVERVHLDAARQRLVVEFDAEGPGVLHPGVRSLDPGVRALGPEARAVQLHARGRGRHDQEVGQPLCARHRQRVGLGRGPVGSGHDDRDHRTVRDGDLHRRLGQNVVPVDSDPLHLARQGNGRNADPGRTRRHVDRVVADPNGLNLLRRLFGTGPVAGHSDPSDKVTCGFGAAQVTVVPTSVAPVSSMLPRTAYLRCALGCV